MAPPGESQPNEHGQLIVAVGVNISKTNNHYNKSLQTLDLICKSIGGNPNPVFEWYHNGRLIVSSDLNKKKINTNNQTSINSKIEKLPNNQFELHLNRNKLTSGDRIVCLVSNKATLRSVHLYEQKLRAEIMIIVHCKFYCKHIC